jgi:polyhydroxybutyrate depolymerase
MAGQLACDASTTFASIAPVGGLRHPTPCPATRPVPVLAFHGTADPVDPYNGGGQASWTYSVPQAAQSWASQDQCSPASITTQPDPGVSLTQYGECAGGVPHGLTPSPQHQTPGRDSCAYCVAKRR